MGDKVKPPALPPGAPKDVVDFVSCKAATLSWQSGKVDWLKLQDVLPKKFPGAEWIPDNAKVEISFEATAGGGVTVGIGVGGITLLSLPASIKGGKLDVDTSKLPNVGGAPKAVTKWVDDLNATLRDNGKQLGGMTLKDGKLTVDKAPVSALLPADGGAQLASAGPGTATKVAAAGVVLAGLAGGIGLMDVGDRTETVSHQVTTTPTPAPTKTATPTPEAPLKVVDGQLGTDHVGPGESYILVCLSVPPGHDGSYVAVFGSTPSGELSGSGDVVDGKGTIRVRISQFGSYAGLSLFGPGDEKIADLGALLPRLPWVVDETEKPCDPADLSASDTEPAPTETATEGPGVTTTTETSEVDVDGKPWSLLLIPGSLLVAGGLLVRRRDETPHTVERAGTGTPDPVPTDVHEVDPDAPPIGFSDALWTALQQGMQQKGISKDGYSPPIVVIAGVETWLIPDYINDLEAGDKVALAFKELAESDKLGKEFSAALSALLSPESVVFFGSMIAIQLIPGVNVAVDIAAFLIMCAFLGDYVDEFIDALLDAGKAVNKQQLDAAVTKLAQAIAGVGTVALTALIAKIAGTAVEKVVEKATGSSAKGAGEKPVEAPGKTAKNPELNKGGVHDALPAEPGEWGYDGSEGLSLDEQMSKAQAGISDPADPYVDPTTGGPMPEELPALPDEGELSTYDWANLHKGDLDLVAQGMEVRFRNWDKLVEQGMTDAQAAEFGQAHANDLWSLQTAGPEFWDAISDPQTKAYLQGIRDGIH